jgi:hypothetical protein
MRRMLAASFAVLLSCAVAWAADQKIEYGDISELRGVKVIFVDSGLNLKFRENAIEALKKELPSVRVGKEEEADVTLQVEVSGSDTKHGDAVMLVLGRTTKPNTVHVIAKYEDSKSSIFTKKLSSVLIGRFARDYRDANK